MLTCASNFPTRHLRLYFAGIGVIVVSTAGVAAQPGAPIANYPSKPIRFIIPTQPGGGVDIIARVIGQRLTESWGQPVVMNYRSGAGGNIGVEAAARASPDGYTLMVSTNAMLTINPHLYGKVGYDPLRDFAPVTQAASSPFLLVLHPTIAATTVKELIAYAKSHPGELNFSSSGNGSATHLAGVLFGIMAGIKIVHIPSKGSAAAITDLLGGQIQMRFSASLPVLQFIRGGKLRAIGISSPKRSAQFPDIPAVSETLPGYQSDIWYGVSAPAKTPAALVARINAEIVRQLKAPEVREKLQADGSEVIGSTPAAFSELIKTDFQRWAKVVKESGARAD